jgi:hypothetical protein
LGGFVAALAVAAVYSASAVDGLTTAPGPGISDGGAFLLEAIMTGLFVIVISTSQPMTGHLGKASWRHS